jgi:DNA-binding NarL/FixJ family response regulator
VRDTVAHYLTREAGVSVELAESLPEALAVIAREGAFDIVLLDLLMPGMEGGDGVARAVAANAGGAVVLFSGALHRTTVDEALRAGVRGVVPKTLPARSLIHALRFVADGNIYLPISLMDKQNGALPDKLQSLSPQETRVLRKLCEGLSNKEIARRMDLSEVTIKTHMRAVCSKLGARNRTHAAMIATPYFAV